MSDPGNLKNQIASKNIYGFCRKIIIVCLNIELFIHVSPSICKDYILHVSRCCQATVLMEFYVISVIYCNVHKQVHCAFKIQELHQRMEYSICWLKGSKGSNGSKGSKG